MKPTKSSIQQIKEDIMRDLLAVRRMAGDTDAMAGVESFCAVALRIMSKTNPSKIRDAAMTVEIQARMDGVPVL